MINQHSIEAMHPVCYVKLFDQIFLNKTVTTVKCVYSVKCFPRLNSLQLLNKLINLFTCAVSCLHKNELT
jgi:hypothetical protein